MVFWSWRAYISKRFFLLRERDVYGENDLKITVASKSQDNQISMERNFFKILIIWKSNFLKEE